jgi:DNA-binding MarR family transcriptional regulator
MARQSDLEVVIKKKGKGNPRARGAPQRLSTRQKRMLAWLYADHQRTHGSTSASHQALVQALAGDKGNVSRSLRNLEHKGLVTIGHTPGGQAVWLSLTSAGMAHTMQEAQR